MKRPTGKHEVHDFPATVLNPGTETAQKGHVVACTASSCTESLFIPANGTPGPYGMPKDAVIRKATQAGWLVRRKGRSVTCPGCQGHRPKPSPVVAMTKAAHEAHHRQAAAPLPRIVVPLDPAVPVHVVFDDSDTPPPELPTPAAAAAPAQDDTSMRGDFVSDHLKAPATTPALRRAINAKLHEVHAGEDGYLADWTDGKVAKALDCSPAAVAAIREDLFGPDTNEEQRRAAAARSTELADIRQQLLEGARKVDQSMATLAEADRLYADALARLAKLEGN